MNDSPLYVTDIEEVALATWLADQMTESLLGVLAPDREATLRSGLGAEWISVENMTAVGLLPTQTRREGFITEPDPTAEDPERASADWLADRILEASAGVLETSVIEALNSRHGARWRNEDIAVAVGLLPTQSSLNEWFGEPDATALELAAIAEQRSEAARAGTLPSTIKLHMEFEGIGH